MELGFVFVLAIVGIVAYLIYEFQQKQRRREEWFKVAHANGLEYAHADPFRLLNLPFRFFRQGAGRGIENVAWGERRGIDVKVFEYWYYTESRDSKGHTKRHYKRFTCAVTELPTVFPGIRIAPETLGSRIRDRLGNPDHQFESEEFNRAFDVRCRDPRFASYLVDPRMMHWLLGTGRALTFETSANVLLVHRSRVAPAQVPALLDAITDFRENIPNVVWEVYGAGGQA